MGFAWRILKRKEISIVLCLFLFQYSSISHASPLTGTQTKSCVSNFLRRVFTGEQAGLQEHAVAYNQIINKTVNVPDSELVLNHFQNALENMAVIEPAFPKEDFLSWYQENPLNSSELSDLSTNPKTVGDLLHIKAKEFSEIVPEPDPVALEDLHQRAIKAKKICGKNLKCQRQQLLSTVKTNFKKLFPCISRRPNVAWSMATGYGIGNLSALFAHKMKPKSERGYKTYSWESMINGTLWTLPSTEVNCRLTAKKEAFEVGRPFSVKAVPFSEKAIIALKMAPKAYLLYTVTTPGEEFTYTLLHAHFQKKRDPKADTSFKHLENNYFMLLKWDFGPAAVRKAIMSPIYYTYLPRALQPTFNENLDSPWNRVAYTLADGGLKVVVSTLNMHYFLKYQKKHLDAKKK
jgi:hypothetical protein